MSSAGPGSVAKCRCRVSGPCPVPLLEADPEAETPWLATAYVPGRTLSQHAAEHGPLAGIQLHVFRSSASPRFAPSTPSSVCRNAGRLAMDFGGRSTGFREHPSCTGWTP
ncbi:hypothetical protein GCM10010510_67200 [Streptomyces anandii JCM 4720]|nr:hypothetical protein GCM10010510_67200 [Streptomyces anandii JCM 4720]